MILRSYKPGIDYSTQLTTDKNMKAKTRATEEEECDQTRDSALPLLDTGTGAEFQNPSFSRAVNYLFPASESLLPPTPPEYHRFILSPRLLTITSA